MKQYVTYLNKIKKSCRNVKYPFLTNCRVRRVRSQRSEVSQVLTPDSTVYRQYAVRGEARGAETQRKQREQERAGHPCHIYCLS